MTFQNLSDLVDKITPDMHADMRRAIELGRFPDGRRLSQEQREGMMQALIAWEQRHLPEEERSGYLGQKNCSSAKSEASKPKPAVGIYTPPKQ